MLHKRWVSYLGLALVAAIWGANFGVSRSAMDTFHPVLFAFLRFGISVPFFFMLLKLKEGSIGIAPRDIPRLALIGLVGVTALEIAVMYSIKYTTLANASLLNVAPWPIFVALLAPLFVREKFTVRLATGGLAAAAGVSLIILGGKEGFDLSADNQLGNWLALGVSLIGALSNLACMPLMKKYSALRVSAWYILFGTVFMAPFTYGTWGDVDWGALTAGHYTAISYNVVLCTLFAFAAWNACMFKVGATRANFFRYMAPATATTAGFLFFNESFAGWQLLGAIFMAAGLVWISLERKPDQPRESPARTGGSRRSGAGTRRRSG